MKFVDRARIKAALLAHATETQKAAVYYSDMAESHDKSMADAAYSNALHSLSMFTQFDNDCRVRELKAA